jgi:hypothetical protein
LRGGERCSSTEAQGSSGALEDLRVDQDLLKSISIDEAEALLKSLRRNLSQQVSDTAARQVSHAGAS